MHTVNLLYFEKNGMFYAKAKYETELSNINDIWEEVKKLRDKKGLPGINKNEVMEYHVFIDVPSHKHNIPKILLAGYNYIMLDQLAA